MAHVLALSNRIIGIEAGLRADADGAPPPALIEQAEAALAEAEQTELPALIAQAAAACARVLGRAGRTAAAIAAISRGRDALGDLGANFGQVDLALAEAETWRAAARAASVPEDAWRAALAACERALPRVERNRIGVAAPQLQAGFMRGRSRLYAIAAHALLALGDGSGAVRMADRSRARGMPARPLGDQDPVLLRAFRDFPGNPDRQRAAAWDALMHRRTAPIVDDGTPLTAAQAALAPDQAAILWHWLTDDTLMIAAFDRARSEVRAVPVPRAARQRMTAIADQIVGATVLPDTQALEGIGHPDLALLLPEFARTIALARKRVVLAPHGILHGLPLQALPTPAGPLGLAHGLSFIPSLNGLTTPIATARAGVAAIWASRFDDPTLSDLPETPGIAAVLLRQARARCEPAEPIDADQPARAALLALADRGTLAELRQIWFCCHGRSLAEEAPLAAELSFASERLDGLDLATLNLRADLAVFLACHAGQRAVRALGMASLAGDDLLGLQGALRVAGARQMLAPQWQLDSSMLDRVVPRLLAARPGQADLALQSALIDYTSAGGGLSGRVVRWAPLQLFRFGASVTGEG